MVFTTPVALDSLIRTANKKVDDQAFEWYGKYHWIVDETKKFHQEVKKIKDEYAVKHKTPVKPRDTREVRPFPETGNRSYGWISHRPEFKLEKYGPDLIKRKPLIPPDYWDDYVENKNII